MIYETNYKRLAKILDIDAVLASGSQGPGSSLARLGRSKSPGFMDLVFEVTFYGAEFVDISLAHYYEQNGDLMRDPEMEIRIYHKMPMIEALTFNMDGTGFYQVVYPAPGKVYPKIKKDLNSFLGTWLRNLKAQGHKIVFGD